MAGPGFKPAPNVFLPGNSKEKFGKDPPDVFIVDDLEIFLATTVDKSSRKKSGYIVERFIEPRASTIFVHT